MIYHHDSSLLSLFSPNKFVLYSGEETVIESIISVDWVAQRAVYTCRIFGKEGLLKLKEDEIPASILEQFSSTLQQEKNVIPTEKL